MQLSTSLFYDRASGAMTRLSARTETLQTQISTGKRLQAASDDSAAYFRLRGLAQGTADAVAHDGNLDLAAAVLAQSDTTLGSMTAQLQRAQELVMQARGGTLDQTARDAIAEELDAIRDQLVSLGNTTDPRGQSLFGGADGDAAVISNADGTYSFASTPPSAIPVGGGATVQPSETAARVFQVGGTDMLTTLAQAAAALRGGTAPGGATLDALAAAHTQVTTVRTSLGARAARVEIEQAASKQAGIDREAARSGIEDTDITAAITELQKTMTVLSATQASFTKLQGLSLFDYLK